MTALSAPRNTPRRKGKRFSYPVSGAHTIQAGSLVTLLNTGGWAVPGGTANAGHCVGIASETVVGGGSNGLNRVEVERDTGLFENSTSTDEITHADIGNACYLVDDQTVAKTDNSGARKVAGAIVGVENGKVWVDCGPGAVGPQGPEGP